MMYCKKDGDFEEHGQSPKTPADGGEMEKKRYKRVRELAQAGDLDTIGDENPDIYIRHYGTLKKIKEENQKRLRLCRSWTSTGMSAPPGPANPGRLTLRIQAPI